MSSSDYYLNHDLIKGFGKLWPLVSLQEAISSGQGISLSGSVAKELGGDFLGLGIFGQDFPEHNHLTQSHQYLMQ